MADKVVVLVEYKNRETIALLRYLTRKAMRGDLDGIAVCFHQDDHDEYTFTGTFKTDDAAAFRVAHRLCWKMNQAMDDTEKNN